MGKKALTAGRKENLTPVGEPPNATKVEGPKRAVWTTADDATLIDTLTVQQLAGNQSDNGWKPSVWTATAEALQGSERRSGGAPKSDSSCCTHWGKLKAEYNHVKTLRELSGWGWDDGRKMVVAGDSEWETYIAAHKWAKPWRTKPFPLYDEIAVLVDGRVATGEAVFRPGVGEDVESTRDESSPEPPDPSSEYERNESGSDPPTDTGRTVDTTEGKDNSDEEKHIVAAVSRKRAASAAPERREPKRSRGSSAKAANHVGDSIMYLAESLASSNAPEPSSSPVRRTTAIRALVQDARLTKDEQISAIRLFQRNAAVADSYIALEDKDMRLLLIRAELSDL